MLNPLKSIKEHYFLKPTVSAHDRELFAEFLRVLPPDSTIHLLKTHDFETAFPRKAIDPLHEFAENWNSVGKEFMDRELEEARRSLLTEADKLSEAFARLTIPMDINIDLLSVYPDGKRVIHPKHFRDDAGRLNRAAAEFFPKYEEFVRQCREKLVM